MENLGYYYLSGIPIFYVLQIVIVFSIAFYLYIKNTFNVEEYFTLCLGSILLGVAASIFWPASLLLITISLVGYKIKNYMGTKKS